MFSYGNEGTKFYNVQIGRFCSIAHEVMIGPVEHPVDWMSTHGFAFNDRGVFGGNIDYEAVISDERRSNRKPTTIGNDVWIGFRSFIRSGVTIGDGAIIAAQSTVLRDVPPYTVVGGSPAKIIKPRFDVALAARLLDLKWWNYKLDKAVLGSIQYSDVEGAVRRIENAIDSGELQKLSPDVYRLGEDGKAVAIPAFT